MCSKYYLLKGNRLTVGERKGREWFITNKHLEWRMFPLVMDCCSIHSSRLKALQPDLAAFFLWHSGKMSLRCSHQQHVFIYKRVFSYASLDCLPNRSPVAHTPGVTHVPDTTSHLARYLLGRTAGTIVPRWGLCQWPFEGKAASQSPHSANKLLDHSAQRKLLTGTNLVASPCLSEVIVVTC